MRTKLNAALAAAVTAAVGTAGAAHAEAVNVTITADNHYALFSRDNNVFSYHGGNELGAGGNPGTYNWSVAESYALNVSGTLYIAAWSDDSVAQGVLAQFTSDSLGSLLSGDSRWEVYATNVNRGDNDPHPTINEIAGYVAVADTLNLWEDTFVGGANGVEPWGTIAGISGDARWMWKNIPGDPDPTQGGSGAGEMLIFRTVMPPSVPAPASAALLGLGGLAAARRRR